VDPGNFDSCEATNSYKFIVPHLNMQPNVHTTHSLALYPGPGYEATHSHEILFMTHSYLTFIFILLTLMAGMQPWICKLFTRPPFLPHPFRKVWEPN